MNQENKPQEQPAKEAELNQMPPGVLHDLSSQINRLQIDLAAFKDQITAISDQIGPLEENAAKLNVMEKALEVYSGDLKLIQGNMNDLVKQISATRVPVPEKELAGIKKFLVEKYHYKAE